MLHKGCTSGVRCSARSTCCPGTGSNSGTKSRCQWLGARLHWRRSITGDSVVSVTHYLGRMLSHAHAVSLTRCRTHMLSHSHVIMLARCHTITLSHSHAVAFTRLRAAVCLRCHTLTLLYSHAVSLMLNLTHMLSHPHAVSCTLSHSYAVALTHLHTLHSHCLVQSASNSGVDTCGSIPVAGRAAHACRLPGAGSV